MKKDRLVTVRVPEGRVRRLMRARGIARPAELIAVLVEEATERLEWVAALRRTAGTLRRSDRDPRGV